VANPVQRLRYFDGEYLRSYDFTDEQSYHIAMRRLMNLRLHLHGIVFGLGIEMDQDSVLPNGPLFFSIAPGMAIDKSGREIVVTAPYSLTGVLTGPGLKPGCYEVWICYQENETGLPAAGYLDCDVQNQNTRFQEAFQIVLNPLGGVAPNCGGVRLGTIDLRKGVLGLEISKSNNDGRTYVGIRAQRIIAPDEEKDQFDITAVNPAVPDQPLPGYLDVHPGVFNRGNVIVKKNQVIGDDFVLDSKTYTNLPNTIPPTGNLKVTSDLFLNGDFYGYSSSDGTWYSLKQYIQSLTAKVVVGPPIQIPFPDHVQSATAPPSLLFIQSNQFAAFPFTSSPVLLAITEMDWQDPTTLQTYWGGKPITVKVENPVLNVGPPGTGTLTIQCTNDPPAIVAPGPPPIWKYPVTNLVVNFVVIYQP
jgi:hypothetical protein